MASKRKERTKALVHKDVRFMNDACKTRYEGFKDKPLIFERGFELEKRVWSRAYFARIEEFCWETFFHPWGEAVLPWVYEFYANALMPEDGASYVRGKDVEFSAEALNNYFNLEVPNEEEFLRLEASTPPSEIAATICNNVESAWVSVEGQNLRANFLKREAKVWLLFINTSLIPTKNSTRVSMDRAYLIYCILKGIQFDVGRIIYGQLQKRIRVVDRLQLWFPTLITELCRASGVGMNKDTLVTKVGHHITKAVITSNIRDSSDTPVRSPFTQGPTSQTPKTDASASSSAAAPSISLSDLRDDINLVTEELQYMKYYMRFSHLLIGEKCDALLSNQARLLEDAGLAPVDTDFKYKSKFDKKGFLLYPDGERIDLSEIGEMDGEDDDDVEIMDD